VARLAVLASGNGGNFEALVRALRARAEGVMPEDEGPRHECVLLAYDRKAAYAAVRAAALGVPSRYVNYYKRDVAKGEAEMAEALDEAGADLVALAGFMRLLSPKVVAARHGLIVNVHPSLLPAWPGAHAIARAYDAGSREFGVTVHFVDEGMDTGAAIMSESFERKSGESLDEVEARVHAIEHRIYPKAVLSLLDGIETERTRR
jgi:formyltetrahydrofolate-dependent phosphoribosylglycinamide formyltransferase